MDFKKLADNMQGQIVKWRRELHQIPEIGNDLPQTSKYVQNCLKDMDIPYVTMVNGSGILATIAGKKPGKTLALRADMDALPINEEAPVSFKSTNGNMHACGHDAHTAMLLGVAKVLNDLKEDMQGTVKLIFQPGEEGHGGADLMIAEGCLSDVDAIFGQHVGALFADIKQSGKIIVSRGIAMASRDTFHVKIIGKGAHSAFPEDGIDPIAIAAQVINGAYMIKSRECAALTPCVISICTIHGGSAANVIPQEVELGGSTRSVDVKTREMIASRMEQVVSGICAAFGATYEFSYDRGYDITENNPDMADIVINAAKDLGMGEDVILQSVPLMGSEDMSSYLNQVPGAYYFLSSATDQDGQVYGHHNPKFMLDEDVFSRGVALFLQITANYLGFK